MGLPQLREFVDIWHTIGGTVGTNETTRYRANVPALVIPLSSFDRTPEFARESTHVVFLPQYMETGLAKGDEIRRGRRTDGNGTVVQYRYVVDGVRRYQTFGLIHIEAFASERE